MKFPTMYGKKERFHSEPGNRMQPEYQIQIDNNGVEILVKIGETDVKAMIQTYEPMVNLQNIIERYMHGDESALENRQAVYADVSTMPETFQEMMNLNLRGKQYFDSLPIDIKEMFDNNYMKFMQEPEKLEEAIKNRNKTTEPANEPETKPVEKKKEDE